MKLFDPHAALAKIVNQAPAPATSATSATQPAENLPHVAKVADVAAPRLENRKNEPGDMRPGLAINGHPKTCTGNVVSLDVWRRISEW